MAQKKSAIKTIAITLIIIIIVVGAIVIYNTNTSKKIKITQGQVAGTTDARASSELQTNNPKENINQSYTAKAIDINGRQSKNTIEMTIKFAEKAEEILIKGSPATAKNGSKFLILQVELKNPTQERLIVAPLDLIRLIIDDQKRAAEIYSEEIASIRGSVIIEPDSTKVTRVGFVLTPDIVSKKLKLQIGEINAKDKQIIDINI